MPRNRAKLSISEPRTIGLVPVGGLGLEQQPMEVLQRGLPKHFPNLSLKLLEPLDDIEECLNTRTRQFHSTRILVLLEKRRPVPGVYKLLGVSPYDLFIPGFNFVFGEARNPGRVAVISTFRLKANTRHRNGNELFPSRVVKEAVHELGHTFGLAHCPDAACVMFFSNSLEDTDRKDETYCANCRSRLPEEVV